VLPVGTIPPTADNLILAEFISVTKLANRVQAMTFGRFTSTSDAYLTRFTTSGAISPQVITNWTAGETPTNVGQAMGDPSTLGANAGMEIGCGAAGDTIIVAHFGERQLYTDITGSISTTGVPAIGTSTGAAAGQVVNYFRNIRIFTVL
jgi:hypothetical protein